MPIRHGAPNVPTQMLFRKTQISNATSVCLNGDRRTGSQLQPLRMLVPIGTFARDGPVNCLAELGVRTSRSDFWVCLGGTPRGRHPPHRLG